MGSWFLKYFEATPLLLTGISADFMFKKQGPSSCAFLTKWTNLTKGNLEHQWPLWGTSEFPKLNFLKTELDYNSSKISELSGVLILIGILRLPSVNRSLKLTLCKVRF